MKLIVTIDTEEDEWDSYRPTGSPVENLRKVPALQALFDRFGVRPTYLVTYPVVQSDMAVEVLGEIAADGRCEIATHCHPWNTPPFEGESTPFKSMLCNLAPEVQLDKLTALHEAITERLGAPPTSFRAGRWGFSGGVAEALVALGYRVDTSVTPYTDWRPYHGPDYTRRTDRPYRFSASDIFRVEPTGPLLQVPATVGFMPRNAPLRAALAGVRDTSPVESAVGALLLRARLVIRAWLSPENSSGPAMVRLAQAVTRQGRTPFLNMVFHSSSLMAGNTPFTRTVADEGRFLDRIRIFLEYAARAGVTPITLTEAEAHV